MTITEQDLREFLDRDSADGPYRGVTVADVDHRARGIRRGRRRALGAVVAASVAVTVVANLPGTQTATVPDDIWTGVMAQPTPQPSSTFWVPAVGEPLVTKHYAKGGRRETFTFLSSARNVSIGLVCPPDSYGLAWLNGRLVINTLCGGQSERQLQMWRGAAEEGRNTVTVALLPKSAVPSGPLSLGEAEEAVAWARTYRAAWSVSVYPDQIVTCDKAVVIVDPSTGNEILSAECPSVAPDVVRPSP